MRSPRLSLLTAALLAATAAPAADRNWDGNGSDNTWSHLGAGGNTNWTHQGLVGMPVLRDGDRLSFGGMARLDNRNDLVDLRIAGLVFKPGAGSFTLGGHALTNTGDILNVSGQTQRLSFEMLTVGGDQLWEAGTGRLEVQDFQLDRGRLTLSGAISAGRLGSTVTVGGSGSASLQAGQGSRIRSGIAYLGDQAAGVVKLDMGARWDADGMFYVGTRAGGTLALTQGGSVYSQGGHVGRFAGSLGQVSFDALSRWNVGTGLLHVGYEGMGEVEGRGLLFADGLTLGFAGGHGSLTMTGAGAGLAGDDRWATRAWAAVGGAGHGRFTLADRVDADLSGVIVQAPNAGADGQGSVWLVQNAGAVRATEVTIGAHGRLRLEGSRLSMGTLLVGDGTPTVARPGTATVQVADGGQLAAGAVSLGGAQSALLSVGEGSGVGFGNLHIGPHGRLLLDGGSLNGSHFSRAAGGQLDWRRGQVSLLWLALGADTGFGNELVVPGDSVLQGQLTTTLPAGTRLDLSKPGATLRTPSLLLEGGRITGALSLDETLALTGHGSVQGRVSGGQADKKLIVDGGDLSLGDDRQRGAVVLGTGVEVRAGRTLTLLGEDAAQLGPLTVLGHGARLVAAQGVALAGGEVLETSAGGTARVLGPVVSHGLLRAVGGGTLLLDGAVSGSGSFAGHVVFAGRFTPAAGGHGFGGGDLELPAGSELSLDIAGPGPVALRNVGAFSLQGRLRLNFAPAFADLAAGGLVLDLADFSSFRGGFGAGQVAVSGLDAARLDFSRFTVDGTVAVTAVPEPGSFALAAAGLLVLLARRRHGAR